MTAATEAIGETALGDFQPLWRRHSDAVNRALLDRWLPPGRRHTLKTDLFDEAVSEGLCGALGGSGDVVAVDHSPAVVASARERHPGLEAVEADVRRLPFGDRDFDAIVSLSTLDHFADAGERPAALRELHRVLEPGGVLVLTLDNALNPLVALRNALPSRLMRRLRIVPYFVGPTCGPRRLRRELTAAGFTVERVDAIVHCPRVLAVAASEWLADRAAPDAQRTFLRLLLRCEALSRLPTRFVTGHFVAVRAVRQ